MCSELLKMRQHGERSSCCWETRGALTGETTRAEGKAAGVATQQQNASYCQPMDWRAFKLAATVRSMSCGVCKALMKKLSNWDGGR